MQGDLKTYMRFTLIDNNTGLQEWQGDETLGQGNRI
jgi:hypothetical protein